MARPLTYRMAQALRQRKPLALLADIDHPDGEVHYWTGVGSIGWNGNTYTGVGKLGSIAPIQRSTELAIQEVTFSLSGIPSDALTWLSANVRNRVATCHLACLDGTKIVDDPYQLLSCLIDYQTLKVDDGGTATISLTALSGFYTLEIALDEVWSSQDQKATYPTDTGFDQIDLLQNQQVKWTA